MSPELLRTYLSSLPCLVKEATNTSGDQIFDLFDSASVNKNNEKPLASIRLCLSDITILSDEGFTLFNLPESREKIRNVIESALGFHKTLWEALNMEAWDFERKVWCRIVELNASENRIGLNNGVVTFSRDLKDTPLRYRKP